MHMLLNTLVLHIIALIAYIQTGSNIWILIYVGTATVLHCHQPISNLLYTSVLAIWRSDSTEAIALCMRCSCIIMFCILL